MERVRRGSEVYIEVALRDRTLSDLGVLFDPSGGVKLTLSDPDGDEVLSLATMTKRSTGIYFYRHQTGVNDDLGIWTIEFKATHTTSTHLSEEMGAFELVG